MAIEREVNVDIKGTSDDLVSSTERAKASIEQNLIKVIALSEQTLQKFNKTSEKTSHRLERNMANSADISAKALDNLTKKVEESTDAIKNSLEASAISSEKQLQLLAASSEIAQQQLDQLTSSAENTGVANEQMAQGVESNISKIDSLIQILEFAGKGLSILGTAFVAIVGKEKSFELINLAAIKFSNLIEKAGLAMQRIGGPIGKLAPMLFLLRDALRTNTAAFAVFAGVGAENVESADAMRKSFLNNIKTQITFTDKMRIASLALGSYGNALLATDGIMNKLKGTTAIVAGATAGFIATISDSIGDVGESAILLGGSFLAIAGIDKLFKPIDAGLSSLTRGMIASQNRAAAMSVQMGETATKAQQLGMAFNQMKVKGFDVAGKGLNIFRSSLGTTRASLKVFTQSTKMAGVGTIGASKAFAAAAKHTELFEKGLAGLVVRSSIAAGAFNFLGTKLLFADGVMNKMAGVTLVALGIALGGMVIVIKQLLVGIGGLIQSMGTGLTAATEKQIELFSKAEKNTFAFTQTVTSYAKSAEDAAVQTNMWNSFIADTSEATGHTTDSIQALVAETVAATEAAHLNEQQMKQLIDRTIDLSERAHKPAMDTLVALINGMNGAGQSVISLGLHMSDSAIQHSKLNKEVKENFKTLSDSEKAQARFAVLMEQAGKAAGFATNNADLLSKSIKLQDNALKEVHAELGRGAAIINSRYVFGLAEATKAMGGFLKPILPTLGFLEALAGKFLSVTGFIIKHTLTIGLLMSSYKALNVLLARGVAGGVFAQQIPILNKSILDIVGSLGAVNPQLGSIKGVAQTTFQVVRAQAGNAVKALIGLDATAKLTAKTFSTQLVKGMQSAGKAVLGFSKKLLLLLANPIVIKFALIAAAIFLVVKALQKIEERTGIFSKIWEKFSAQFAGSASMFDPVLKILQAIGNILMTVVGAAVKFVAASLSLLIGNVLRVVKAFMLLSQFMSAVLPDAMVASEESMKAMNAQLDVLNNTALEFAKEGAKDLVGIFFSSAEAADSAGPKMKDWTKQLAAAASGVEKMEEKAKKAFEAVKDFTPKINMAAFIKETAKFDVALKGLKKKLEAQKLVLIESGANESELKAVESRIAETMEAIKGLQIRTAEEVRSARIREVEIELQDRRNKSFTVEQEIKQIRVDFANETRWQSIEIETQRLLAQRKLETDAAQEGTTIRQAALIEANAIELEAFRNKLEAQKAMAINVETEKQLELAQIKAEALAGTPGGVRATENLELIQEQQKIEQLTALRNSNNEKLKISESEFQQALTSIRLDQMQRRTDREIELQTQRDEALGLTPTALEARLTRDQEAFQMQLERMTANKLTLFETEKEFQDSIREAEVRSLETRSLTRQKFLQEEITQNEKRGNNFAASLGKIKLAQQKHGQIMGALMGVQQTAEFKGVQGALSNLSSLRNSKSRKAFEVGRATALAGAGINIASGMIAALAPPPLGVGPVVGPILAGTIAAAGAMQMAQISAQKFPSGGQADQGMDSIPKSLSGKSFILSAGERVVQPEANKKLTAFLDGNGAGATNNISINIGTVDSEERVEQVAQRIKQILREDSERGEPIISSRGVVNE